MNKRILTLLFFIGFITIVSAQLSLIPLGAAWKYKDSGVSPGNTWTSTAYNDANWATGNAQLGYGEGDEATIVNFGVNPNNKFVTTYFRKVIAIQNLAQIKSLDMRVKRDDGIVMYVNGVEVYRDNMPAGIITYSTFSSTFAPDDGQSFLSNKLPLNSFVNGNNVIAIEIHQNSLTSSDLSFDFELLADTQKQLVRGPYLQSASENSIIVRWRTFDSLTSMVKYGVNPLSLNDSVIVSGNRKDHIVQLSGLQSNTKYYYSVGSPTMKLEGNADNYFYTHPVVGAENKYRFWIAGDCGTAYQMQYDVRDQFENYRSNSKIDGFLLLGDNAYTNGLDNEYQTGFFDVYKEQLKHFNLWPTPGNHDYWATTNYTQGFSGTPYFSIFSTPQNGQSGGVPSNNPAYYSYNYGNVHFVALDSYGQESGNALKMYDTNSSQIVWLKNDLAANSQRWTVLYWHHPPYTKGSHNSDVEGDLIAIRENVLRIVERYKVDLVLNGHSHNYERSKLINGHYGVESTYNSAQHDISSSSAQYNGTNNSCPYIKNGSNTSGTVYLVAGNAGKVTFTSPGYPHNAMAVSETVHGGSLVLDVEGNRLDCKFVGDDGIIRDQFTMMKDAGIKQTIGTFAGQTIYLSSSYIGSHNWNNNLGNNPSIGIIPSQSTNTYTVADNYNCVVDTFQVNLITAAPIANFTFPTTICQNQAIKFFDQSSQTPFAWSWTFAGANIATSNLQNPTVKFLTSGTYNVSLVATNLLGASTVFNQTVFVNATPNVSLTATNYVACKNGSAIPLTGTPSGGTYIGSGLIGNSFSPSSVNAGNNNLSYVYTNNLGCSNTVAINIKVNPLPIVSIGSIPDTVCLNSGPFNLVGSPLNGTFFGAGVVNNSYTPVASGSNFNPIYYTFTDTNACTNVDTKQVYVSTCTGLQDLTSEKKIVLVYPNPNGGSFMIKTTKNIPAELVILDEVGRLIRTVLLNKTNNFMLPVNLKSGYYFLKGKVDGVEVQEKIVVGR
jgi:Calcineurin-like phosphoesterase/PKD domain/Purple acid Phosphatase, N-terminal domain/Secretion system C-terminal sorting domain